MKRGTCTTAPLSTFAGFEPPEAVSPFQVGPDILREHGLDCALQQQTMLPSHLLG